MRLPRLTRTLTLEAPERTEDGSGGHVTTWVVLGTLFAEVKPGGGRQAAGLAAPLSRLSCRIIVRGFARVSGFFALMRSRLLTARRITSAVTR